MAAEQLPTVVISAANLLCPIPATATRAKTTSGRVKIMAMQEYPMVFSGSKNGSPKGSNAAAARKNIDCEVSQ